MGERLGSVASVAVGAASCRGFASRRAACTLPILGARPDARKSLEVSSYRLSDSGISLQIRPKASEKTRRMQNLPRNRIGNQVPSLANPTLELRHDFAPNILRTILSVNKMSISRIFRQRQPQDRFRWLSANFCIPRDPAAE